MVATPQQNRELKVMSPEQLAECFGVHVDYVTKHFCTIPGFPFIKIGKRYFFESNLVYEWMKQNKGSVFE